LVNVLDWPLGSAKRIEALRLGAVAAMAMSQGAVRCLQAAL